MASGQDAGEPGSDTRIVLWWIEAVRGHQPGLVDESLRRVAARAPGDFAVVAEKLRGVLRARVADVEERNDILRRGAMLHTDVAILLPERAATFVRGPQYGYGPLFTRDPDTIFVSLDGELRGTTLDTAHWWMARLALHLIAPRPSVDPFVPCWYRAASAYMQLRYNLGSARFHLDDALELLPHDPVLLLYAGALHEAQASPPVQSMMFTDADLARRLDVPSPETEWRRAERLLRESASREGPAEATVRLGRVLGRLRRHEEAATVLRGVAPRLDERRLQFLCALFLGSEEGALGRAGPARESFERAAALCPTAQSPLVALADLGWRRGDRTLAREALVRLQRLPYNLLEREDPWQDYGRSLAFDAEVQMARVRASISRRERR